jgi:hypothetical protein
VLAQARRELLDYAIALNERHLWRLRADDVAYHYDELRLSARS